MASLVRNGLRACLAKKAFGCAGCRPHSHRNRARIPSTVISIGTSAQLEIVHNAVNVANAARGGIAPWSAQLLVALSLAMACATMAAGQPNAIAVTTVTLIEVPARAPAS